MDKYQDALLASINRQVADWLGDSAGADLESLERFLHSIKGTAGTIGLEQLSQAAALLYDRISGGERPEPDMLRVFLEPLLSICRAMADAIENQERAVASVLPEVAAASHPSGTEPLVLVLDDDPTFLQYVKENMEQQLGWIVMTTVDPEKAIEYFHDMKPDCFVTDLNMPGQSGLEVLASLREKARRQFIPTMVVSGFADKAHRLDSYRLGADDFMMKPIDWEEWVVRIERLVNRKREWEIAAMRDGMTGAYTKAYMPDCFEGMLSRSRRRSESFCLVVLDLDRFKQVNDRYGHAVGDQVLTRLGQTIRQRIRSEDVYIRFGGEEFVLLLANAGAEDGKKLVERLLAAFSLHMFAEEADPFSMTFSAGVVGIGPSEEANWEDAFKRADAALYEAKSAGRNRVHIAGAHTQLNQAKKLYMTIIDDDEVMRCLLEESLQEAYAGQFELEIESYRDGTSYFGQTREPRHGPSFFLLDGIMPRMDGLEILRKLRESRSDHPVYIMMLTNRKSERDIVRALELGADDYLTKPFSMNELQARIDRLVRRIFK